MSEDRYHRRAREILNRWITFINAEAMVTDERPYLRELALRYLEGKLVAEYLVDLLAEELRNDAEGEEAMNARRASEIESAMLEAIPNEVYQPDLEPLICQQCSGATDDHKANCFVPLVYELLADVKRRATNGKAGE